MKTDIYTGKISGDPGGYRNGDLRDPSLIGIRSEPVGVKIPDKEQDGHKQDDACEPYYRRTVALLLPGRMDIRVCLLLSALVFLFRVPGGLFLLPLWDLCFLRHGSCFFDSAKIQMSYEDKKNPAYSFASGSCKEGNTKV
jgi:hypothetical protein